ncbi:hypothetical protein DFP94_103469 [Fontibacillus phaseoli]|uniref:PH (Pleckstrin Homology) domain-containing protein n=1 Tax=Fontibacillus phaseoli TaxID=1416533 RepID=A0A369BJI3_9BACL|nr:hypothetical protein [Fontibacillus phaseoli]RCX20736.1 hypothetical protein DFP94_103469 [Fontibacillus phaseoli]
MRGFFIRIIVRYLIAKPFLPAERGPEGEMKLRKSRFVLVSCLLGFLICAAALPLLLADEAREELMVFVYLIAVGTLLLFIQVIQHLIFRAKAGESWLSVRTLGGKRMLNYGELQSVGYTRFFGGQFLLQGASGTVRIPAGIRGASELIELLSSKIGGDACAEAQKALNVKRAELENWSR